MGRTDRLNLLFGDDASLLQIDTHLKAPIVSVSEIQEPSKQDENKAPKKAEKNEPQEIQRDVHLKVHQQGHTSDQMVEPPVIDITQELRDTNINICGPGSFCPLVAVSRFPYKFVQGDLSQPISDEFFAEGKFWQRQWDIYYIQVPPHLGHRPLLLVPTSQVEKLLREINRAFETTYSLPTVSGFGVSFQDGGTPQPAFLGQSTTRERKDYLESRICTLSYNGEALNEAIPEHQAFEQKIEAAVKLTKNEKASKLKKQQQRIQLEHEWVHCLERTQSYFGLRPGNQGSEEKQGQPTLDMNSLPPYPFLNGPVFISIDVESNERCHSQVTEVGISTLDPLDLTGVAPGEGATNWRSQIRSRHLRVKEHGHIVNRDFIAGCPDRFEFGESEWVGLEVLASVIEDAFTPRADEGPKRNVVLVGHNPLADIKYLQDLGVAMFKDFSPQDKERFLETIDTAEMFRVSRQEMTPRSLGNTLAELGITGWHLHNAGNDARYTMEAMVGVLF